MGSKQSATANWSIDDWAYGTGENAVTLDEVVNETKKIPAKYFGGNAIENDPSMHQMQHDLLAFDDTLKNLFRRKKNRRPKRNNPPPPDEYYYEEGEEQSEEVPQSMDSEQNQNNLQPIYTKANEFSPSEPISDLTNTEDKTVKAIWRCGNCTVENKITERVCRRCGQAETRF